MSAINRGFRYISASISQGVFGFISLLVIFPALSNTDLGYIAALEALAYLFSTLAGFNLDRAASRFYFLEPSDSYRVKLYSTLNYLVLLTLIFGVLGAFIFENFINQIFPELPFMPLVVLVLIKACIDIFLKVESAFLVAGRQSELYSTSIIVPGLVGLILSLLFVLIFKLGVLGFILAQLVASVVRLIYLTLASIKNRSLKKFDRDIVLKSLAYSWPFFPTLVSAWILSYYDRILLSEFVGMENLGIYALSLKLAGILLIATGSIVSAVYPIFYDVYSKVESEKNIGDGMDFSRALISSFTIISLALLTIGSLFFELIIGDRVDASLVFFGFAVINYWIGAVGFIATESLMRARATAVNMILSLFIALIALGLNRLLIPSLGISGALVSGFFTYMLGFLIQLQAARRWVPVPFCWKTYVGAMGLLIISALLLKLQAGWEFRIGLFALGILLLWKRLRDAVILFNKYG